MSDTTGTPPAAPPAGTPPAGNTPPPAAHLVNEKGEFSEGWTKHLPEDLREAPALKNFKSLEGMAKSLLSAQRMVGAEKVVLPNEHSTDEERAEFLAKLGRPEKPDGYGFKPIPPEKMPKGMQVNTEFEKAYANKAWEIGLSAEQANKLRDWHNEVVASSYKDADTELEKDYEASVNSLKKEWGNGYQARVDLANRVVATFDKGKRLVEMGLGNNIELIKMFSEIGKSLSEDKLITGEADKTPANAQSEINRIIGDKSSPYWDKDHPQHKEVVAKVASLFTQKNPES